MRLTTFARRSAAVTAATALLTGGFAGSSFAGGTDPTIDNASPSAAVNSAAASFAINGNYFVPALDTVTLVPNGNFGANTGVSPVSVNIDTTTPGASTPTQIAASATLTRVAPGSYTIHLVQQGAPSVTVDCIGCFSVTSLGAAGVKGSVRGTLTTAADTDYVNLDVLGGDVNNNNANFAKGAQVHFLRPDLTEDTALSFKVKDASGYVDWATIKGEYTYVKSGQPPFTPGRHLLQVNNTEQPYGGATADFFQPSFKAVDISPSVLGAGATNQVITIAGQGIRQGSSLAISSSASSDGTCASDVSMGNATVNSDGTSISAPVTIKDCATGSGAGGSRTVSVLGPDGGYYALGGAFTINPPPAVSKFEPAALGQGGTRIVTLTGSFKKNHPPVLTFDDPKVTAVTDAANAANSDTQMIVAISAAPDATVGNHGFTITNPFDHGSKTYASSASQAFTIDAGPTISSPPSPGSIPLNTSKTITVKGSNFDVTNGMSVDVSLFKDANGNPIHDVTVTNIHVTAGQTLPSPTPDTLTFTLAADANAIPGLRDVYLHNSGDNGTALCVACIGIDSMALSPNAGTNSGAYTLHVIGKNLTSTSSVELIKVGDPAYQPHIVGQWLVSTLSDSDPTQADAQFTLTDVAPGNYDARVVIDATHSLACASCFTIAGQTPTITSVTPNAGGQGAQHLTVHVVGTHFSRGQVVNIPQVTVNGVTFVDSAHLDLDVSIAPAATTGAETVTITNADGQHNATLSGGFTVNAGPAPTTVTSPASGAYGQGAGTDGTTTTFTVTGTCFATGADAAHTSRLDLGPGVTVGTVTVTTGTKPLMGCSTDTMTAPITIAVDAPAGPHNVTVTNPDAGQGVLSQKFTVNAGPAPASVMPHALAPGASQQAVTITGTGFVKDSHPTLAVLLPDGSVDSKTHLDASTVTVVDANTITVTVSVDADAVKAARTITVTNADKGFGKCSQCLYIATTPGAPQGLHVTSGAGSLTAAWTAPADNGGAPVQGYVVTVKKGSTVVGSYPVSGLSRTITGLTNGTTYTLSVQTQTVAGLSPATSTTGIPGVPTTLTSATSVATLTYGGTVTLSGKLTSGSTALAGKTVTLRFTPAVGTAFTKTVTTSSAGTWSYAFVPPHSFTVVASYAGDATYRPVTAAAKAVAVAVRILFSAPANGSTSKHTTALKITGTVSPDKHGVYAYLYRYSGTTRVLVQRVTLSSTSTFAFSTTPGVGTWTYRVYVGAASGNAAGYSTVLTVHRT